jgi:hypothetical protein
MMEGFDHILNWKLKAGSHPFPGPDGGTCINEAALVAAGFEYRPINFAWQMPRCFSRPICRLAMWLNDHANDRERQRLLPFVMRLACADTWWVECKRWAYIQAQLPLWTVTMERGIEILEGALAIGRQAEPLVPEVAHARLEAVKEEVLTASPKPKRPLLKKVKSWLTAELEPAN